MSCRKLGEMSNITRRNLETSVNSHGSIKFRCWKNMNKKQIITLSLVQYILQQLKCNSITVRNMKEKMTHRAAKIHFTHFRLLPSEVIIFQAGKAYSNLDLNNIKYNNNKQPTVQKQHVNVCMYV